MPNIAAANLFNYLKSLQEKYPKAESNAELKQELEVYVDSITKFSEDNSLNEILVNHGWDEGSRKFGTTLDVSTLRKALTKKVRRLATRTSILGASQNNTCKSFVPGLLLSYLYRTLRSDCSELKAESFTFKGVCLLVDISGFTRLSGSYCDLGKEGIDDLQRATNGYMGKLVEVIYFYGLDIIKFAGDAIICVSTGKDVLDEISNSPTSPTTTSPLVIADTNESTLKDLAVLALCCAMDLRNISTDLLTVHVAVSYGMMCFGVVGGVNDRWDCLISGECLMQISQCLDDAPSRHVAITQELALLLGEEIVTQAGGKLMPSGNYLVDKQPNEKLVNKNNDYDMNDDDHDFITSLADTPDFIRLAEKFVPTPVLMSLKSASMNSVIEIREVTTIFMKWDSYSVDRFPNLIDLNPYFRCAQQILMNLGAFIRQFLVDDKGCVLIACFGVPTASHLDNTARALRAAVTIRTEFNAMNMECSFGITTGNVYCGDVGSVLRREFAAVGDVVNLAARLMSKAKHGILIDENTYSRLSFEFISLLEALPPMQVKGKTQPIQAYRFIAETLPLQREGTIEESGIKQTCKSVLRRHLDELASVATLRRSSVSSTNRRSFSTTGAVAASNTTSNNNSVNSLQPIKFVLIEGKIGTGKRSAARWLMQESEQLDLRVISCRLDPKDAFVEFSLISKLFWLMVGQDSFTQVSNQRLVIMHILREVYGDDRYTVEKFALPAMRVALGVKFSTGAGATSGSNNDADQPRVPTRMVRETMLDIFEYLLKELPSVLIIESMHYADEESLRTLLAFRELKAPTLITFTSLQLDDALEYLELMSINGNVVVNNATSKGLIESFESFYLLIKEYQHATLVTLDDFNVSEIDAMLRASLKNDHLPLRLAAWVHQLSGGSIFWIKEIIEYLRVTTPEEFLSIIDGSVTMLQKVGGHRRGYSTAAAVTGGYQQGMSPLDVTAAAAATAAAQQQLSLSINIEASSPVQETKQQSTTTTTIDSSMLFGLFNGGRVSNSNVGSPRQHQPSIGSLSNNSGNTYQTLVRKAPSLTNPTAADGKESQPSPQQQQQQTSPKITIEANRSKLDLFVICRFEKLSLDNQLLLKMASVIGFEFSRYVLYGILNSTQKTTMFNSLKLLVRESWITKSESKEASYLFNHPLIHTTIYQLTPFGERSLLHKIIGKYYENMNPNEPLLFSEIARHFSHSDPNKAVEYALRAADYYLRMEHLDADTCITLLAQYLKHCQSVIDVKTLLAVAEHCRLALIEIDLQQDMNSSQDDDDEVYHSFNKRRSLRVGGGGAAGGDTKPSKAPAISLVAEPVGGNEHSMFFHNKTAPSPATVSAVANAAAVFEDHIQKPKKSSCSWFCCGNSNIIAVVVPQNLPDNITNENNNKSISISDRRNRIVKQAAGEDDHEHSSMSMQSTRSRQSISAFSYTVRGRKILNKRLHKLVYEDAEELTKRFILEGRSGAPSGWQAKILQFDYAAYLQASNESSNIDGCGRSGTNDERSIVSRTTVKSVTVMRRR